MATLKRQHTAAEKPQPQGGKNRKKSMTQTLVGIQEREEWMDAIAQGVQGPDDTFSVLRTKHVDWWPDASNKTNHFTDFHLNTKKKFNDAVFQEEEEKMEDDVSEELVSLDVVSQPIKDATSLMSSAVPKKFGMRSGIFVKNKCCGCLNVWK